MVINRGNWAYSIVPETKKGGSNSTNLGEKEITL